MQEVIITGANGLIGSACVTQLQDKYSFTTFDISDPNHAVDITDRTSVSQAVSASPAKYVIHFAAYTDVTGAWRQSGDTSGPAYTVNVLGTKHLVDACNEFDKHLIHISTAYVFDGEKREPYVESDTLNPIEWYGETKAMAEAYVQEHAQKWTILRIDQPFRAEKFTKLDIAHKIAEDLHTNSLLPQFTDHYFGPTWIPDFIRVIDWVISENKTGLYHASSGESWTNYDFATFIARTINSPHQVGAGSLAEYLQSSNRPYQKNTALNCSKLQSELPFTFTTIEDALKSVRY